MASTSVLEKIVAQRRLDVIEVKKQLSFDQLKTKLNDNNRFISPNVDLYQRLRNVQSESAIESQFVYNRLQLSPQELSSASFVPSPSSSPSRNIQSTAILAEIKRASPSKGDIAPNEDARERGICYALSGAAAISVLTEPKWFKGHLEDMLNVRQAVDQLQLHPNNQRPAILRKDFLVDEYQIYEAKYYGADTILLIVAAIPSDEDLKLFISVARTLGMEPLVEVGNGPGEMERAIEAGAKVIGINNRNLHDFTVDLSTTERTLANMQKGQQSSNEEQEKPIIFVALSGISTREDVAYFESIGVRAVLVGESLMRARNPFQKIRELLGTPSSLPYHSASLDRPLVKICGIRSVEMAIATAEYGADFIGLVFASQSRRKVSVSVAKDIVHFLHLWRTNSTSSPASLSPSSSSFSSSLRSVLGYSASAFNSESEWLHHCSALTRADLEQNKPLIVGVFADQTIEEITTICSEVDLDIIQLCGYRLPGEPESVEIPLLPSPSQLPRPSWRTIHVPVEDETVEGEKQKTLANQLGLARPPSGYAGLLLDASLAAARGGTGRTFDWNLASKALKGVEGDQEVQTELAILLAGGLSPANVKEAVVSNLFGKVEAGKRLMSVDVSSGVEKSPGEKHLPLIRDFINNVKTV